MSNGLQNFLSQLLVRIAVAIMLAMTTGQGPQAAEPPGYWSCDGIEWVAVGAPEHPKPLVSCGAPVITVGVAITQDECEEGGGVWGPIGLFPEPVCSQRTLDAGRYCADMGECAASCDAVLTDEQYRAMMNGEVVFAGGQCSPATPLIGCHAMVFAGKVDGMLCID